MSNNSKSNNISKNFLYNNLEYLSLKELNIPQTTIKRPVTIEGYGLHTNNFSTVTIEPAPVNFGIKFERVDLKSLQNDSLQSPLNDSLESPNIIPALGVYSANYNRNTSLLKGDISIMTIEHLMAALYLLKIDNVLIKIDNNEVPILDGSAAEYVNLLKDNIQTQEANREIFILNKNVRVEDKSGSYIEAFPSETQELNVYISFKQPLGEQKVTIVNDIENLENVQNSSDNSLDINKILSARTFVFLSEILYLYQNKLIKGGNLKNAIVFVDIEITEELKQQLLNAFDFDDNKIEVKDSILNNKYRMPNEPAYHKAIDVFGDLSLLGKQFVGKINAYKPGHAINAKFVNKLLNINN